MDDRPAKRVISGATKMQYGMFKKARIDENEDDDSPSKPTAKQLKDKKRSIFAKVSDISSDSESEKKTKKNVEKKKNTKI